MGEARRKKQLGITEPSNPNWKRRPRKFTRRDEAELQQEVMSFLGIYPALPMELIPRKSGGLR